MNKKLHALILSAASLGALLPGLAYGQATNSGDIRGTVVDSTGALTPGVTVTVKNLETGVTKVLKTNSAGLYDTSSIVVGTYSVTFEGSGFETYSRPSITLQVGISTVNATMKVGATTDSVVVNTDIPLLDTESGTQQTTLDAKSMQDLPNVGQDWQNFAILIPGSAGLSGNSNPGQEVSVNGNLPYNNVLSDGASTSLGTSGNSDVNVFETVQEVQISTSAFSAQYGIGGIIFNQISKGGTSQFHGSVYDYFQSDEFNANGSQFIGAQGGAVNPKNRYRYNNYGVSIGGPIIVPFTNLRKKAFFYFDYDRTSNNGTNSGTNDIPTVAVMGGDFTGPMMQPIYDPTTQTLGVDATGNQYPIRRSFASEYGSNIIPAALFDPVAVKFQTFYPTPSNHIPGGVFRTGSLDSQGILKSNFFARVPVQNPNRKYFGRIDYDVNSRNRVTGSVTQGDIPAFTNNLVTAAPVQSASSDISRLNLQISDVTTFSPHLINEARFGFTYQGNFFADLTYGKGYPQQLGFQFAKADEFPGVQFYTNYPYAWIEPVGNQFIYKENVFDPSDVVTFIKGRHVMHFGGEVGIYRNDNTPYGQINPGIFGFSGNYTAHYTVRQGVASRDSNTGADYADFLLGDSGNWSAQNGAEYGARLKNPQFFFQDDYKVRPNLTLNLGLRYQLRFGISEVHGDVGTYDPTVLNPGNGQLGAYWYGATHANGRNNLTANSYNTVLPRVGFSYLPNPSMTIRGGFGLYAYNLSLDTYGGGLGNVNTSSGNYGDPTNGVIPGIKLSGPGTEFINGTPLPFATPGTSPTRFNGQSAQYTQYNTPDPKIYQYNVGVQQAFGTNTTFELAYVGSHGFNLSFPTDINQVPTANLSANDQKFRPNQNYIQINGSTNNSVSNYNSLQASVNRRLSRGLSVATSYTWSHFLDSQDSSSFGSRGGPQVRQFEDPAHEYSNSNFDIRNSFKARVVYEVPVGRGRAYFNNNRIVDAVLGGYQVASTVQLASGNPFSIFAYGSNSYSEPGTGGPTLSFPNYTGVPVRPVGGRSVVEYYNPAAFSFPQYGTFGNVRRNAIYGPGYEFVNASVGKRFAIYERVKLQVRADANNVLNHFNPGQPSGNLNPVNGQGPGTVYSQAGFNFGSQINSGLGRRTLQGGLRLEF